MNLEQSKRMRMVSRAAGLSQPKIFESEVLAGGIEISALSFEELQNSTRPLAIVICNYGVVRSPRMSRELRSKGIDSAALKGGMNGLTLEHALALHKKHHIIMLLTESEIVHYSALVSSLCRQSNNEATVTCIEDTNFHGDDEMLSTSRSFFGVLSEMGLTTLLPQK